MLIFPSREDLERFPQRHPIAGDDAPRGDASTAGPSPPPALALSAFIPKHAAAIFKVDTFAPVCESYFDDEDREVRFAVPYEAFGLFDVDESADQDRSA